jgi:hypothetical protein
MKRMLLYLVGFNLTLLILTSCGSSESSKAEESSIDTKSSVDTTTGQENNATEINNSENQNIEQNSTTDDSNNTHQDALESNQSNSATFPTTSSYITQDRESIYVDEYITFRSNYESNTTHTYQWVLDGKEVGSGSSLLQSLLKEGSHTLELRIEDGNATVETGISFRVIDPNYPNETLTFINQINHDRLNVGVTAFKTNYLLGISALNHAKYVVLHQTLTHSEIEGEEGFTGMDATARAKYVGYSTRYVSEVINYRTNDVAYESLMTAIYHRFGLLNPIYDEINVQYQSQTNRTKDATVGNMATYAYSQPNYSWSGVQEELYLKTATHIYYPYDTQTQVPVVFYEENPDPLPNYGVSGYPISMQLNHYKVDIEKCSDFVFELYKGDQKVDAIFMTYQDDPNSKLKNTQFILFPKERLHYNTEYKAIFQYSENANVTKIEWSFKTKQIDNLYTNSGELDINATINSEYIVYMPPLSQMDSGIKSWHTSCKEIEHSFIGIDRHLVKFNVGTTVESCYYEADVNSDGVMDYRVTFK